MNEVRAVIEVTVGLVPMQPIPELSRRWVISSEEWRQAHDDTARESNQDLLAPVDYVGRLLTDTQGQAMAYAQLMMLQPSQYNFVRVDWIYL